MDKMIRMKEMLMSCVETQMGHLDTVDTKELGEVIDMVKDLSEAIYYCTVAKAMEDQEEKGKEKEYHYYTERYMPDNRMTEKDQGRMYYGGYDYPMYYSEGQRGNSGQNGDSRGYGSSSGMNNGNSRGYTEREMPFEMRDEREGRSYMSRKTYMESKEMHQDKNVKLKDLEKYMQELTTDMVEMIQGASPEEKQLLEKRISSLATKIGQVNV